MSYARADQPTGKFLMEFGILRQKAEKHMFPSGGGFGDLFICFQCIKAARLKPNEKTLLMASLGGAVDYSRMSTQLRQLFHSQGGATKEDIFPVTENRSIPQGGDLSYEAWAAFRKQQKQSYGEKVHPLLLQIYGEKVQIAKRNAGENWI